MAKKVRLTPEDARQWLDHLHTVLLNRRRRAKKAAATRAKAASARMPERMNCRSESTGTTQQESDSNSYYCGTCGKEYEDESEAEELWIGCDMCKQWYCGSCEGLSVPPEIDIYLCVKCRQ